MPLTHCLALDCPDLGYLGRRACEQCSCLCLCQLSLPCQWSIPVKLNSLGLSLGKMKLCRSYPEDSVSKSRPSKVWLRNPANLGAVVINSVILNLESALLSRSGTLPKVIVCLNIYIYIAAIIIILNITGDSHTLPCLQEVAPRGNALPGQEWQ